MFKAKVLFSNEFKVYNDYIGYILFIDVFVFCRALKKVFSSAQLICSKSKLIIKFICHWFLKRIKNIVYSLIRKFLHKQPRVKPWNITVNDYEWYLEIYLFIDSFSGAQKKHSDINTFCLFLFTEFKINCICLPFFC